MNYGYIQPKIKKEDYILGASPVPFIVVRNDGNWFGTRPKKELQNINFETYNCTSFNTLAQIEAYMKEVFKEDVEYSDRWLGIIAGTRPPGNSPELVYDAIRRYGLIPEAMLPWSEDLANVDEYYSFKGADREACYKAGREWLEKYEFFHEWIATEGNTREEKIHNMKTALKSSPLTREVFAWAQDDRGIYVKLGSANHWTFVYAHDLYDKVEDSYDPTLKDVDQDFDFCKRIYIRKRVTPVKKNFWEMILAIITKIFQ